MSDHRTNNSLIFLTTLTVYLGLVLVGSCPTVLAQAATTRDYDIRSEVVVEDELDKKPDEEVIELDGPTGGYYRELEHFVNDLQDLHRIDKFNPDYDNFEFKKSYVYECGLDTTRHSLVATHRVEINNNWLVPAVDDAVGNFEYFDRFSDCRTTTEFDNNSGRDLGIEFNYDGSNLRFELAFTMASPAAAQHLADVFNRSQVRFNLDYRTPTVLEIHRHTTFSIRNNQVLIVTNLPRASIDEPAKR